MFIEQHSLETIIPSHLKGNMKYVVHSFQIYHYNQGVCLVILLVIFLFLPSKHCQVLKMFLEFLEGECGWEKYFLNHIVKIKIELNQYQVSHYIAAILGSLMLLCKAQFLSIQNEHVC